MPPKMFFDPVSGTYVPGIHDDDPAPIIVKPDPSHIKQPALFFWEGSIRVTGEENGAVLFNAANGRITRAQMRALIAKFTAWDTEEDV